MLIFYILCGCFVFALSGLIMHFNRLAIYRRRIIRHLAEDSEQSPFVLSEKQEKKIKHCFSIGKPIQKCVEEL